MSVGDAHGRVLLRVVFAPVSMVDTSEDKLIVRVEVHVVTLAPWQLHFPVPTQDSLSRRGGSTMMVELTTEDNAEVVLNAVLGLKDAGL